VCPNAGNGCTEALSEANMNQHLEMCPYSIIQCPNNMPLCQPFLRKDISKHENECQSYTCPYASEGCSFIGTLYQANAHCDNYCGRLHKRVDELENECARLNKLINEYTFGLNMKLPSTPETNIQDEQQQAHSLAAPSPNSNNNNCNNNDNNNNTAITPKLEQLDAAMSGINIFSQIFSNDPFNGLDLPNNTTTNTDTNTSNASASLDTPNNNNNQKDMMDITACLPDLNFLDPVNFDSFLDQDDEPLSFMAASVPKRTVNGKRIRYSKNPRLAHNALRWARQRTASSTLGVPTNNNAVVPHVNPTNDAILHNLDIAKQKASQQNFKNLEDVTKFLNTNDIPQKTSPEASNTVSSPPSTSAPKRKPMFILASSYLSNYNNTNESGDK
jgi:hypothetical protein